VDDGVETPSAQNPFGVGGAAFACFDLGGTVAPFAPGGVESCTVKSGTKVFVVAQSVECSTFEGNGTTEAELRTCARESDVEVAPTVTVDGSTVLVAGVDPPCCISSCRPTTSSGSQPELKAFPSRRAGSRFCTR